MKCPICRCNVHKPRKVVVFTETGVKFEDICFFCELWCIRILTWKK